MILRDYILALVIQASASYAFTSTTSSTSSSTTFVGFPTHRNVVALRKHARVYNQLAERGQSMKTVLFGIMDEVNSDAFNLLGNSNDVGNTQSSQMEQAYEVFLAELVFSSNDPRMDIVEKADKCMDETFLTYLDNKIKKLTDVEEKMALRDLYSMILDIKEKMELNEKQAQREQAEKEALEGQRIAQAERESAEGRALSDTEVLRRADAVNTADVRKVTGKDVSDGVSGTSPAAPKKSFMDEELSPEIRMSYDKLLKKLHPPYKPGQSVESMVKNNYSQCDAQLIKVLTERVSSGDADSQAILDALATEQKNNIDRATEKLKKVLAAGDPMRMQGVIVKMARNGEIDEPFLLLLEANAEQAKAAGATGPASIMTKLKERAIDEKDKQSTTKEVKLLRQLMRATEKEEREKLLEDAFTPRETLLVPGTSENAAKAVDGEQPEEEKPMPDVSPPEFINACKAVLINFGNLGTDNVENLTTQIKSIAAEAEIVATRIYGKGMSNKEQQDRMWKEQTTSIFDLETLEIQSEQTGEKVPWGNEGGNDILPGFDAEGRMQVGGS